MNRATGRTLKKNKGRFYMAAAAMMEEGLINAIDRTRPCRNRKAWLKEKFGGAEQGFYDDLFVNRKR